MVQYPADAAPFHYSKHTFQMVLSWWGVIGRSCGAVSRRCCTILLYQKHFSNGFILVGSDWEEWWCSIQKMLHHFTIAKTLSNGFILLGSDWEEWWWCSIQKMLHHFTMIKTLFKQCRRKVSWKMQKYTFKSSQ